MSTDEHLFIVKINQNSGEVLHFLIYIPVLHKMHTHTSFKSTPKSPKAPQDVAANRQKSGEIF